MIIIEIMYFLTQTLFSAFPIKIQRSKILSRWTYQSYGGCQICISISTSLALCSLFSYINNYGFIYLKIYNCSFSVASPRASKEMF